MVTLIVIVSIITYIFVGLVDGKLWYRRLLKTSNCFEDDLQMVSSIVGLLWPILPLLVIISSSLWKLSDSIVNRLSK